jgi:endogenous inhibitor of DNA gyrase (YacG/DUF329 family)
MNCPICKTPVADDGPNRPKAYPFCSDRCKLIDLGRWLDGKYQIPVAEKDESDAPPPSPLGRPHDN